ncbi:MAG: carbon monoxide dehydrogenase subunit G [Gemmatimonadaceae bacterium]
MKIAGDYVFSAPRAVVWDALLDPKVLASVLPGCERLELVGPDTYEGQLKIRIGPVQGDFSGKVTLQNLAAPTSYGMVIDGRGAPGFVKATANITLADDANGTRMSYDSDAQVGGKIASVGQRLLESSAKAIVKQSLEGLNGAVTARATVAQTAAAGGASAAEVAAAVAAAPTGQASAPSTIGFAAGVATEVAKDLISPTVRRILLVVGLALLAVLIARFMF